MAVIQGISTIFGGFLYAAAYLRSGSILAPILMHALYDYMCFVTAYPNRWTHHVMIGTVEEVDEELLSWIVEAAKLRKS